MWPWKSKPKPEPKVHNLKRTTAHIRYTDPERGTETALRTLQGRSLGRMGYAGERGSHKIQQSSELMEYAMTKWWVRGPLFEIKPDVWIQHSSVQKIELTHEDYYQNETELDEA